MNFSVLLSRQSELERQFFNIFVKEVNCSTIISLRKVCS